MKTYFTLGALGLGLACCLAAVADTEPGAKVSGDIQDIVFFSQTRPVLIRLDIRNAKSSQVAWEEFLRHLLGYLDKDKDGILSMEEAARTPPAQVLFSGTFLLPRALVPPMTFDQPQADRDGRVTVEELQQYYRRSGAPFQIQVRPGQAPCSGADGLRSQPEPAAECRRPQRGALPAAGHQPGRRALP